MLLSRLISMLLRAAQFIFATIVLGLTAYFLHQRVAHSSDGPFGRVVYTIIWASLSIIAAVIWAIPTTSSMTGYVSDLIFTVGWAASFGLLVHYFQHTLGGCGSAWDWSRSGFSLSRSNMCGQWRAAQAFAFLSMVVWFATFVLGLLTVHRLSKREGRRTHRHSRGARV